MAAQYWDVARIMYFIPFVPYPGIRIMNMDISVIIPTRGKSHVFQQCLASLARQTVAPKEVVIVDNTPINSPFSIILQRMIKISFSDTLINVVIVKESKEGSAIARNRGIDSATFDHIVFLDDDCIARKDWVESIYQTLHKSESVIFQGKSLNGNTNSVYACVEYFSSERIFRSKMYKEGGLAVCNFLDTKNFALTKSFLHKYPHFDLQFKQYEDIDYSIQLKHLGLKVIYEPRMVVWHFGRSSMLRHINREFKLGKGYYLFTKKWKPFVYKENKNIDQIKKLLPDKTKKIDSLLKKEILKDKSLFFRIVFLLLVKADRIPFWFGYAYAKYIRSF